MVFNCFTICYDIFMFYFLKSGFYMCVELYFIIVVHHPEWGFGPREDGIKMERKQAKERSSHPSALLSGTYPKEKCRTSQGPVHPTLNRRGAPKEYPG